MKKRTRNIVRIDEDKCDGCGLCVPDCAEGAIRLVDGKARLVAEQFCDGLGNCLGACPNDAITIEQAPVDEFDEHAVRAHLQHLAAHKSAAAVSQTHPADGEDKLACGCPGTMMRKLQVAPSACQTADARTGSEVRPSRLGHWPIQLTLLPMKGQMWEDADVLLAADCVGFAMPDFHDRLLGGKTLAVACPKLDDIEAHIEKLASIFANNTVRSLTIAHMEVPCCATIMAAVGQALELSGRTDIPVRELTIGIDGSIVNQGYLK
ncbi:MAG: 4Fe-4S binding protein [Planctomycetes bacterium]|nr:4Fe-4S binding protein [Planctomycetota bacterium]